jgi:putative nucleotidyltransferase-like protein
MPSLHSALSALLPDAAETLLLRSCLATGDACRHAWADFQKRGRELTELFRTDRGELKRLGPLLHHNLRRNGAPVDTRLLTVLRTGFLREQLRAQVYRDILGQALAALESAGVNTLLLGGAALGAWAYDDPTLRHSHDIDLLVAEADLEGAIAALRAAGFASQNSGSPGGDRPIVLSHRTGLPLRLRTSLYELSCHPSSLEALRAGSRVAPVGELSARFLGPEDSLAHVLGRACFSPTRSTLQWASDAWMISARGTGLDPEKFLRAITRGQLLLPASVLLRYLAGLGAPIPVSLVEEAEQRAEAATTLERDLALYGLRRGAPRGLLGVLQRMPNARTRVAMLWWLVFPSRAYVRWAHQPRHSILVPVYYVTRVASVVADMAPGSLAGLGRGRTPSVKSDAVPAEK